MDWNEAFYEDLVVQFLDGWQRALLKELGI